MAEFLQNGGSNGGDYDSYYTCKLSVWENSTSIADNTSNVGYKLELISGSSGRFQDYQASYSVTLNGVVVNSGTQMFSLNSHNTALTICEGTTTIGHNSDGSKNLSCSAGLDFVYDTYSPGDFYPNGNFNLSTIPRYVNITSFSVSNLNGTDGLTGVKINYSVDANCDYAWWRTDTIDWTPLSNDGIVSGLTPGTNYNFKIRLKRTDSQLTTDSGTVNKSTYRIATITWANDFNSNQNPTMSFANDSGAVFNPYLEIIVGGSIVSSISRFSENITSASGNYEFNLTQEERNLLYSNCPNSTTLTVRYVLQTSINGVATYWNYVDKTMTVVNSNPTFENYTYEDVGTISTTLTDNNQTLINGYNVLKVTIPVANKAIPINSATMVKYRLVCGNKSAEANYSSSENVYLEVGYVTTPTFMVYAIDSRGNSTVVSKSATTWKEYLPINITSLTATRTNNVSAETTINLQGFIWNDTFGAVANTINLCTYRYKESNSQSWIDVESVLTPVLGQGNSYSLQVPIRGDLGAEGFTINKSFYIEVSIDDKINTYTYQCILGSGKPNISIHENGVAIDAPYNEYVGGVFQVSGRNVLQKNILTIAATRHIQTFGEAWYPNIITNMSVQVKTGNELNFSNNSIIIGPGVSKVLVSGYCNYNHNYSTDRSVIITKNRTQLKGAYEQNAPQLYLVASITPFLVEDVIENDIFNIELVSAVTGSESEIIDAILTVEVVE